RPGKRGAALRAGGTADPTVLPSLVLLAREDGGVDARRSVSVGRHGARAADRRRTALPLPAGSGAARAPLQNDWPQRASRCAHRGIARAAFCRAVPRMLAAAAGAQLEARGEIGPEEPAGWNASSHNWHCVREGAEMC